MLNDLLEESSKKPKEGKEGKAKEAASRQEGKGKAPEGRVLANFRAIRPPGRNAKNRADMLVSVDEESLMAEKRLPVFVTCAESAEAVIEVVLSVYASSIKLLSNKGSPSIGSLSLALNHFIGKSIKLLAIRAVLRWEL
eukprot:1325398-Amorphochlora_amoeboformis.AAC.1